jgi:ABC-2 type transport system ATP-binding protein
MDEAITEDVPIIQLDGVTKKFDGVAIIENCTVALYPNHVYGLVGRSGAGKSTLLRLMMGIYLPTSGTCTFFGEKPPRMSDNTLCRIGYVHQEDELISWFTGSHFLSFIKSHYVKWNQKLLMSIVDSLEIPVNKIIRNLSPGERQCLAIAAALAHEPDVLILDEPASGLDPLRRELFLKIILEYVSTEGRTVLISSHLLGDLDRIIDHIFVLHNKQLICNAPLDAAKSMFVRMVIWASEVDIRSVGASAEIVSLDSSGTNTGVIVSQAGAVAIRRGAAERGWHIEEGAVSLEETFSYLVTTNSSANPKISRASMEFGS